MKRFVYAFDEGGKDMKALLGGKGANLSEMRRLRLPVPDGFTVTTEACKAYYENGEALGDAIQEEILSHVKQLQDRTGKTFGDDKAPLFVSVRSGAAISMPGMMDTILNLGMNAKTAEALAQLTNNPIFAYMSYARFIQMFADVVLGIPKYEFDAIAHLGALENPSLEMLKETISAFLNKVQKSTGMPFPEAPEDQLMAAVKAVFRSWNTPRAKTYRAYNHISDALGTAVNVQMMVFGNMGETSGTGVAFSRNPSTGVHQLFGEFLLNAQGEDVVAGIRTPEPIAELERTMPEVFKAFEKAIYALEHHYGDMQDVEFTIELGTLYFLQTRTGKRTAEAALKIAVDMIDSGMITVEEALLRVEPLALNQLLHPRFSQAALAEAKHLTKGLPASPGAATGRVFFDPTQPRADGILMRVETSPEDIESMVVARGIVTAKGGMTSHAAVVARGMGKCCVAGCGEIYIDEANRQFSIGDESYPEGTWISIDGSTGHLYLGTLETEEAVLSDAFERLLGYADGIRRLGVRANADTPRDAETAVSLGAEGIGLCRTEHMFFDEARITTVREMILAETAQARAGALDKLLPYQREDFKGIFRVMGTRPVTIRLLDPPLHEFLPSKQEDIENISVQLGQSFEAVQFKIKALHEVNPMLGHRGCRLAISYPEIYEMQTRAIAEAAIAMWKENGVSPRVDIMIPLIGSRAELTFLKARIVSCLDAYPEIGLLGSEAPISIHIGTMIEVPRAALTAGDIAEEADFFSFGTNDLTQMTLGISRDDGGKFIGAYTEAGLMQADPFEQLDQVGVGALVSSACEAGRATKPELSLGVCGEHGGDPSSIEFFNTTLLDYVSCSPFRVPIARLSAAQAVLKQR